jgi:predicted esterase
LIQSPEGALNPINPFVGAETPDQTLPDQTLPDQTLLDEATITVGVRRANEPHKRTFSSPVDGSVQYYAVLPAAEGAPAGERPGILLALHGAGVEASDFIANYEAKPWAHVVAPNNRRKFGFDWEDWGRLDAMEALADAQRVLVNDSRRVYATGHSMGGHGALVLGITYPDQFAAIGPSAGWNSFLSYGGVHHYNDATPTTDILLRGFHTSDVLQLKHNLASIGVYLLHGREDAIVPVDESRNLRQQLATFHTDFAYYEKTDGGHITGRETYDWPAMMDFLARHELPTRLAIRTVDFATIDPGVASRSFWVEIEAQQLPLALSEVSLTQDPEGRRISGHTKNVARLSLDVGQWPAPGPVTIQLDGQTLGGIRWPSATRQIRLIRENDQWRQAGATPAFRKGPHRNGAFKDVFGNRVILVYGTLGTPEENAWSLAKARFDAESFWYRGNGSIDVVADVDFDPSAGPDRNVVVYGNADTNGAWKDLLATGPIQLTRDSAMIEIRPETGDLAGVFIRPRPGSDVASVGVVGGTSLAGMKLTNRMRYFVSGVAFPDVLIVGPGYLTDGLDDVRMTGYFGPDWGVNSGEIAWRDAAL